MARDRPGRRAPDITIAALEKAALRYLERFAASSEQLRRVLMRRVKRAALLGTATADAAASVDAVIARYLASGLLDDRAYAEAQAGSLQRRGASRHRIRQRLAAKGVARDLVEDAVQALADDRQASELAAASALARRRRLGPYRAPASRAAHRQKDLAALARAGFALDLARRVLAAPDPETLEQMIGEQEES